MRGRRSIAVLLAGAGLALTACSATIEGDGRPGEADATTAGPPPSTPTPAPPIGPGTLVEAHRLAGATLLVGQVLPELNDNCAPTGPYVDPAELESDTGLFVPGTAASILQQYGFVAAWSYCRTDGADKATTMMVAELSDPTSAAAAVDALLASLAVGRFQPTELPEAPEARALIRDEAGDIDLHVLRAVGRMLVYAYHSEVDAEPARRNASAAIDAQAELLADFRPTPQADVPRLDPDPFDLAARVLDPPAPLTNLSGSYGLASYLRVSISPDTEERLLLDTNFVGTYLKQSVLQDGLSYQMVVYQFASLPDADAAYQGFKAIEEGEFDNRTTFFVPELPTTPCYYFPAAAGSDLLYQRCYVRVRGYLASVDVTGITDPADTAAIRALLREQRARIDN